MSSSLWISAHANTSLIRVVLDLDMWAIVPLVPQEAQGLSGEGDQPRSAAPRARAGITYLWVGGLGHPGRPLAAVLGVRLQAAYQAVDRGRVLHYSCVYSKS